MIIIKLNTMLRFIISIIITFIYMLESNPFFIQVTFYHRLESFSKDSFTSLFIFT